MAHSKGVLILTSGGTIDKRYPEGPGAYAFEFGEPAVEKVLERACPTLSYKIERICAKDSQDITDADREDMLRAVVEGDQPLVLITHGTDSMRDTALFLIQAGVGQGSQFGPGVGDKTVVLTGAFKPEAMKDSDADFNIGMALGFLHCSLPGVFVAMGGSIVDGNHVLRCEDGKFVDDRYVLKRF